MISVALDPGKWKMGLAVFHDGVLRVACPVRVLKGRPWSETDAVNAVLRAAPEGAVRWDIERPQVYRNTGRSSVQDDVEALTHLVDRLAHELRPLGAEVHLHAPYAWKRSVPKKVHHRRLKAALSPKEAALLVGLGDASLDVWDAVGIGLFALGRVGVGGSRT
jgi:hypothetical protein